MSHNTPFCGNDIQRGGQRENSIPHTNCGSGKGLLYLHHLTGDQEVADSTPAGLSIFMEIDHEIFSAVIPSLLLIQEGQLSVSGERMCTILVNRLED